MTYRKNRRDYRKNLERYKVQCERSGFTIWSDQIVIDHRGHVTSQTNNDPKHPTEMDLTGIFAPERPIPFARLEGPDQFVVKENSYWNTDSITWDSDFTTWESD